jgi:hypothetical protein
MDQVTNPNRYRNSRELVHDLIPVRVKDVILDENHPEITSKKFRGIQGIGVIKYVHIDQSINTEDSKTLPFAFPLNNFSITLPLVNEVVYLVKGPREDNTVANIDYYVTIVGLYNDINYLESKNADEPSDNPGYEYKVNQRIRPLYPFNGDTIIQSRLGSSIRFTGTRSPNSPFSNISNANKPLVIISSGHENIDDDKLYIEDVNKDQTSIYLTSHHNVPLLQIRDKYASAKDRPILADNYTGAQIVSNSGRMFFNAYKEDIQFSANKSFGVTAEQVFVDGVKYIGLDAKKIYLGQQAKLTETQPVIRGEFLEVFLNIVLTALDGVGKAMTKAKTVDQKPIPTINLEGPALRAAVRSAGEMINPNGESLLKSTKVFTE